MLIAHDPMNSDDRNGARTHIVWDGAGYGIFAIMGYRMYFARVDESGNVLVPMKYVTQAFSQHFSGQFGLVHQNGAYFVAYAREDWKGFDFMKVSMTGEILATTPMMKGFDTRSPQMFEYDGLFYVLTNEMDKTATITVFDENAAVVPGKSGPIGAGVMFNPAAAYDPTTKTLGMVYQYQDWQGEVRFQVFKPGP